MLTHLAGRNVVCPERVPLLAEHRDDSRLGRNELVRVQLVILRDLGRHVHEARAHVDRADQLGQGRRNGYVAHLLVVNAGVVARRLQTPMPKLPSTMLSAHMTIDHRLLTRFDLFCLAHGVYRGRLHADL